MAWAALLAFAVFLVPAPGTCATQGGEISAVAFDIREQASSVEALQPPRGRLSITLSIKLGAGIVPQAVGLEISDLAFDVALANGRFHGRVDSGSGRTWATVRARGRRVDVRVKGVLVDGAGGALGNRYLQGCNNNVFWDGMVYGMHPVIVRVNDIPVEGVLATAGRSAWTSVPWWNYGDYNERARASVHIAGRAVFPSLGDRSPRIALTPEQERGSWSGRVRGCALGVGTVPTVTVSVKGQPARALDPLNSEALDFGTAVAFAPGVQVLDVGGMSAYQVLFDTAVPEAVSSGAFRVVAQGAAEETNARACVVQPPQVDAPVALDVASHVLEARGDGAVWAWEANYDGQVGDGTKQVPRGPVRLPVPAGTISVAAGDGFSVAADAFGTVWQWGYMMVGDPFDPVLGRSVNTSVASSVPFFVGGLSGILEVSAGDFHALALDRSGRVWAWGENDKGELGDGTRKDRSRAPKPVHGLPKVSRVAAGAEFSLALDLDGRVWAWGKHRLLQDADPTVPTVVQGLPSAKGISARGVALVLASDGTVWAWGRNWSGEVGDGTKTERGVPIQVSGISGVLTVSAGDFHSLALRGDGTVWAWGDNSEGQLGDGTAIDRTAPVPVRDLVGITAVGAGDYHSIAVGSDGSVWSWGSFAEVHGAVGTRRGGAGIYPQLLPRVGDGGHFTY